MIENVPDAVVATDSGEIGSPLTFKLIEAEVDAVVATDSPETTFLTSPFATGKTLMLAEIKLSPTIYLAGKGIRHPTRMYRGKVKSFGSIIRSIPVPTGIPQISDAVLDIIDTDGELRGLFASTPPNNREVVLKIGDEGEAESLFGIVYTGIINHATFPPGLVRLNLKDISFQFLKDLLPNLLTRENFVADPLFAKNLRGRTEGAFEESEIFSPIVFGVVNSDGLDTPGAINAVRLDSTTFNLAQHPIPHAPIRLFEKLPTDQEFIEITGGFSIVEVAKTIEGVDYVFTHAVFGSAKPDQYELRWDGEGMTDTGTKEGTVVRDPAECIRLYLVRIAQRDEIDDVDGIGFAEAGAAMALVVTGGSSPGLFLDGAITQRMKHQEAIARMIRSFGLFLFANKEGKLTIRFIDESDPDRPVLTDLDDIYVRSERHSLARPVFNEVLTQYNRTFSDQNWNANLVITDEDAVVALARTERVDHKLFFVRDDFVADSVGRNFLQFTAPTSFRIVITTPGHRRNQDVELGRLIGITNYSGIAAGGYFNKEFLIHKIEFLTDTKQLRVHAVARAEQPISELEFAECADDFVHPSSGAGAGVYGAYLELIPVTTRQSKWVGLQVINFQAVADVEAGFDLAIGAAGFEVPIPGMTNIGFGWQGAGTVAGGCAAIYYGGLIVPLSSRLSIRVKDDNASARAYTAIAQLWS